MGARGGLNAMEKTKLLFLAVNRTVAVQPVARCYTETLGTEVRALTI
jgi:hypothetical protein